VFLIIFLRREALEITIRAIKRTQIPISVLGATLPILSEIDKDSFEVTIENLPVDVNMRIRSKIPPEGESAMGCLGGFLELCPCEKSSLDCVILRVLSSRIHKNMAILIGDVHFAIKLIDRPVINLRGPLKSNASAE
jgi:hypothetical protein